MTTVHVEPAAVRLHGADVEAAGSALGDAIGGFQSAAYEVNDAFGFMGPSAETMAEYLDMASETIAGLQQLAARLQADGAALRVAADNYQGADEHSTCGG